MSNSALYTQSQAEREARAVTRRRSISASTTLPAVGTGPELEVDHIECVGCGTRLVGVYVRVRDGLCRNCQREAKAGNR